MRGGNNPRQGWKLNAACFGPPSYREDPGSLLSGFPQAVWVNTCNERVLYPPQCVGDRICEETGWLYG